MARSYGQHCALAAALDRVGERWTLLIVRELLVGPARYADLRAALPGVATNLLADRLRRLQEDGLVERRDLHLATAYVLTEDGRALDEVVAALMRWGDRRLGDLTGARAFRPQWLALAAAALARPSADGVAELRLLGQPFALYLRAGQMSVTRGPAPDPSATLTTGAFALHDVATGARPLQEALDAGDMAATGDVQPLARAWARIP